MTIVERAVKRALRDVGSIYWIQHEAALVRAMEEVMAAEDNPADEIQPTKEEWDKWERERAIQAAVAEEREACAKLAETVSFWCFNFHANSRIEDAIAFAIRARAEAKP